MSSSTYTPNLGIEEPATGSYPNTWGDVANRSYRVIDAAIGGVATITLTGATYHLTTTNGTDASNALYPMLTWSGAPGAAATVTIAPNTQQRLYIMANRTTDNHAITFTQGGGAPFTLQSGYDAHIYCDGNANNAGVAAALQNPQFNNMLVTGTLTIQGNLTGNLNLGNISAASLGLGSPTSVPDPLTINGLGSQGSGQIRLVEVNAGNYGAILRNDGNSFFVMATAANTPYGPFVPTTIGLTVNLANGAVTANQGLSAPTIQSTGPLYAGTVVNTVNLNAVSSIAIDTGQTNGGGIDLFFGASTEGIGSARSGGAPQNQGGLTLFTAGAARLVVTNSGPVGINMMPDGHWLCVNGPIHSASGGFVFPDGSVQTTAISGTLTGLQVNGNANITGTLGVGGLVSVNNNINLTAGHTYQVNGVPLSSGISGIQFWYGNIPQAKEPGIEIIGGFGITVTYGDTSPGNYAAYTITNSLQCDERVKRNIHPLQGGLSVISQLRPIEAEFNGLGATREGERTVGVLAQELERVLPGSVVKVRGKLRPSDVEETDLLYIGTYELLFQMLLAIQQLYHRSEMLYGRST